MRFMGKRELEDHAPLERLAAEYSSEMGTHRIRPDFAHPHAICPSRARKTLSKNS
jgi:hypothetical protein